MSTRRAVPFVSSPPSSRLVVATVITVAPFVDRVPPPAGDETGTTP